MSDLFKEKKEPVKKKTIIIKYPQLANPVKIAIDIVDKRDTIINRTEILKKIGIKEKIQQPEQQEEPSVPEPLAPPPLTSKKKPLELKTVKKPKTEKQQEIIPNPDLDIIEPGKMKIINTYEEALEIGKKYIAKATASKVFDFNKSNINSLDIPPQIANPIWQMTAQALTNTLDYLFKKLHHSFYMLCIMDNNSVIYKVEMTTAAPTFINAIKTIHLPSLEGNTLITDAQKNILKES